MTDVSVTAASVAKAATTQTATGIAGATLTAGQAVYLDSSGIVQKAQATSTAAAAAVGITLDGASSGQPVVYATSGPVTIGGTLTKAGIYVVAADTAGGIAPLADLATGNNVTYLGWASTTGILQVGIIVTGITSP